MQAGAIGGDGADGLPGGHLAPEVGAEGRHMGLACDHAITIRHLDAIAIARFLPGKADHPLGGGIDRRANRPAKLEAGVKRAPVGEGIGAIAEPLGNIVELRWQQARQPLKVIIQRAHPLHAEAEPLEARIEAAIGGGGKAEQRAAHRLAPAHLAKHGIGIEAEVAHFLGIIPRAVSA